jgi:hypothetical protein
MAISRMRGPLRAAVKAAYAARFVACRPAAALRMLAAVHASRQRSRADEVAVAFNALLIASILHRRRGDNVVILDQGGVQALVSVLASARAAVAPQRRSWGPLLLADRCVVLRVDASEAARRLALRPGRMSRVEELPEGERAAELRRIQGHVTDVTGILAVRRAISLMVVSATDLEPLLREPRALLGQGE